MKIGNIIVLLLYMVFCFQIISLGSSLFISALNAARSLLVTILLWGIIPIVGIAMGIGAYGIITFNPKEKAVPKK